MKQEKVVYFWMKSVTDFKVKNWTGYSGQGISGPRTECLSVYQWSVPEKHISRVIEEFPL